MDEDDMITIMIPKVNALDLGEYWGTKVTRLAILKMALTPVPDDKLIGVRMEEEE